VNGCIYSISTGGILWKKHNLANAESPLIADIQAVGAKDVWVVNSPFYLKGYIYHTSDAGDSWSLRYDNLFDQKNCVVRGKEESNLGFRGWD